MLDLVTNGCLLAIDLLWLAGLLRGAPPLRWTLLCGSLAGLGAIAVADAGWGDGFAAMRALSWLLFVHGPLVLLALAARVPAARVPAVLAALVDAGIGADAFLVEPHRLEVRTVEVRSDEVQEPLRIVVLADVQSDRFGAYEQEVFARAAALDGDLILLPGDFVQARPAQHAAEVAAFRALLPLLRAPLGVWAVQGNAEDARWAEELFAGTGVQAADETTTVDLGPITLSALSFGDGFDRDAVLPAADGFHVAFAHAPDFSLSPRVDADLLLAGHTHGGQVQLPFFGPLLTLTFVSRDAAAGIPQPRGDGGWLVVSRGIGMERGHAPRLRFGCRPEIVVIEVMPR